MTQSGFIAAIDLGTSKITGVIGRKNENDIISILASESIPSENSIRRGMVYNIEETGAKVRKLVAMLENSISRKVAKVYVSLAGQSLHTMEFRAMKQLSPSGIITEEVVNQLHQSAEKFTPEFKRRYAIADIEYYVDDKPERNPVGVTSSQLEADFELIVGRPNLLTNIEKSIQGKAQLQIADYIVGPLASAAIALNNEEKELGCAFVDFGGGTTTISVYKGGILRHMVVIPFGGKNITKDICELNFIESEAEQLKMKFGKAFENTESNFFNSPFSQKPDVDLKELNKVIALRLDEITANIKEQIKLSGYEGQLGAGLIITGGASQLKNMDAYLKDKLGMPVRKASAKKTLVNNSPELTNNPAMTQALGLLFLASEDCEDVIVEDFDDDEDKEETKSGGRRIGFGSIMRDWKEKEKPQKSQKVKKEKPQKEKKESTGGLFSKFESALGSMFSEEDDDQ